jgi:dihydrofolate synthase/folylpolyglutamate synthase
MLALLAPVVDRLVLTMPPSIPMLQRWSVSDVSAGPAAHVEPDFDAALREVQEGAATVLVTGSFHTVGDALSRLPGFAPVG